MNAEMTASLNLLKPYHERNAASRFWQLVNSRRAMLACLLCSLSLHALALVHFTGAERQTSQIETATHSIQVELNQYTPERPAEKSAIEPRPLPQTARPAAKVEPLEPQSIASKKPAALATTKTVEQPAVREQVKPEPTPQQPSAPSKPQSQAMASPPPSALLASARQQYLQRVAAHLDQHKFYPRAARRRHIEGAVKVSFDLLEDGNISNLQILSGHSSLQKAAEDSIYHAQPLPARPQTLLALNSIKIEYAMRFSLQD